MLFHLNTNKSLHKLPLSSSKLSLSFPEKVNRCLKFYHFYLWLCIYVLGFRVCTCTIWRQINYISYKSYTHISSHVTSRISNQVMRIGRDVRHLHICTWILFCRAKIDTWLSSKHSCFQVLSLVTSDVFMHWYIP